MHSIAIHSYKGGTGKTIISINLAVILAKQGYRVCILDADFSAPNLHTYFNIKTDKYLNQYIKKEIEHKECIHEVDFGDKLKGKLFVGLSDPLTSSMEQMIRVDARTAGQMLQRLYSLKSIIQKEPYKIDFLILDTTPGIGLTTINSFVLTKNILFVIKLSNADIDGTKNMITGLLERLPNKSMMIANQIPSSRIDTEEKRTKLSKLINAELEVQNQETQNRGSEKKIDFIGWIPTDVELQTTEFDVAVSLLEGDKSNRVIYALDHKDHAFTKAMKKISKKIFEL